MYKYWAYVTLCEYCQVDRYSIGLTEADRTSNVCPPGSIIGRIEYTEYILFFENTISCTYEYL